MKEDNAALKQKGSKDRNVNRLFGSLIGWVFLRSHPKHVVGAATDRFKQQATPEQLEALKEFKTDNIDNKYVG